jgi:hypothetical protein
MNESLFHSIENGKLLGKEALYFGCWEGPGHYLHNTKGHYSISTPVGFPWDIGLVDSGLLKNRKVPDIPTGKVYWTCGGDKTFWYAFYWWDRSIDKRGNCNSGFYVRGFGWPESDIAFAYACEQYPQIIKRQIHRLVLQSH